MFPIIPLGLTLFGAGCSSDPKRLSESSEAELAYGEGIGLFDQGFYKNAIPALDKAIQLDPDYADAYNNRGWSYANLGEYQTAIADYTKAIQLDRDSALAYTNRGNSYRVLVRYASADADETTACSLASSFC